MGVGWQAGQVAPFTWNEGQEVSAQDEPGDRGAWRDLGVCCHGRV